MSEAEGFVVRFERCKELVLAFVFCACFNVVRENQVKWKYTEIEYCSGYQLRLRFCTVLEIT